MQSAKMPRMSPIEALENVRTIGKFSSQGFLYEMDEDDMSVTAENIETGKFWQCSGEYYDIVTEETTWITLPVEVWERQL
jgi:hypothetical protein